jgi:hypothetical protein
VKQDQFSGIRIAKVEQYQDEVWLYYTIKGPYESEGHIFSLIDRTSGKKIQRNDPFIKNKKGFNAMFKTSQPIQELAIIAKKNKFSKLEDLKLEINIK